MTPRTAEETGPSRPLNVEQIVNKAQNFDYNPLIPLKYWLRTAGTLLKEVMLLQECLQPALIVSTGGYLRTRRQRPANLSLVVQACPTRDP